MSHDMKAALRAQAAALRAQADAIEAMAETCGDSQIEDPLLSAAEIRERYSYGVEALRAAAARGELQMVRGARGKLMARRSAVEAMISARSYKPGPRRTVAPANDLSDWDAEALRDARKL